MHALRARARHVGALREVVLETVGPSDALLKLLTYTVIYGAATALGVAASRLRCPGCGCALCAIRTEWLPEVGQAIAEDLQPRSIRTSYSAVPIPYR